MKNLSLPIRFGLVICGLLIAYFLVLAMFSKHTSPIFSLFNSIITGVGLYETIKIYKLREGNYFNYINGFKIGLITGTIATLGFTIFFAFYATEINPSFYDKLQETLNMEMSTGLLIFGVAMLGMVTTLIATLTLMQLFKPSNNLS
jgi:formate-dependent nitrite reductase membrane component NrfD